MAFYANFVLTTEVSTAVHTHIFLNDELADIVEQVNGEVAVANEVHTRKPEEKHMSWRINLLKR